MSLSRRVSLGIVLGALGCGGQVEVADRSVPLDGGLEAKASDARSEEAGAFLCGDRVCSPGQICKYEVADLDAAPCCSDCLDYDAAVPTGAWTCASAEFFCRLPCLKAEWPYVYCMIE